MTKTISSCEANVTDPDAVQADPSAALRRTRPTTKDALHRYLRECLGIVVPDRPICPEHRSPMDYLWYSFSEAGWASGQPTDTCGCSQAPADLRDDPHSCASELVRADPCVRPCNGDLVVWANRGGGKTQIAAVATLLDAWFKPNCQIRILGGSGDQSLRMYEYVTAFLRQGYEDSLAEKLRKGKCRFTNGSVVEILKQSATSVRGTHVQKLRCDEVELFRPDVFAAAKFTTQSTDEIVAAMELISTMHRPYGLMQTEVAAARNAGVPVFQWCVWETIEKCRDRICSQCPLWSDCQGRAQEACGYLRIDDCITQMRRSSRAAWECEMLCLRPSLDNAVFAEFDPKLHVRPVDYDPGLLLYRSMDFGFVNPFVCLWIQVDHAGDIRVIDEYVRRQANLEINVREVKARTPCPQERVAATYCDPSGAGRSPSSGERIVEELRALGIAVKYRRSEVLEGIELIRRAIRSGDGKTSLVISPNCPRLIEAMECYHYCPAPSEQPNKDGVYDHAIDALRYFFINRKPATPTTTRRY